MSETKTISREQMHKILELGKDHNWLQYLRDDEFAPGDDKIPLLHGLQRLANIRGIRNMQIDNVGVTTYSSRKYNTDIPLAFVSVRIEFMDGHVTANAADCHIGNCSDLGNFPTAVASSRAIARALSDAFNIKHVKEELDPLTADDAFGDGDEKASDLQMRGIKSMAKMRKLDVGEQIKALFNREDLTLESLSNREATKLMTFINNGKA
jgi:hypothetical protein